MITHVNSRPSDDDRGHDYPQFVSCPECGEDLTCGQCEHTHDNRTERIRLLNDAFRASSTTSILESIGAGHILMTSTLAAQGQPFLDRALQTALAFDDFTADNDPYNFGLFEVDGVRCMFKIDYYDRRLEYGSPNPADPKVTRRVLTIMLASDY